MALDPQQALFGALLMRRRDDHPDSVYDTFLPPRGTPYPFEYLADNSMDDSKTKSQRLATVTQTIDVWHDNPKQRGTVSARLSEIKESCYDLKRTNGYRWEVVSCNQQILPDNTTETPLLHGILTVTFRLLGGQDD